MNNENMTTQYDSSTSVDNQVQTSTRMKYKLICASKCKKFALEVAKSSPVPQRSKMFTRVSEDFLIACEVNLKNFILNRVKTHPSKGKTLM